MGKLAQATSKYTIVAIFHADGTVEKPDVIGAVFGQTEGLLGPDMDLRELQRTGRIGRIDVEISTTNGKSSGKIIIPSSLDSSETALLAATIETIERVGPCSAKIRTGKIEDVRNTKRKYVVDRAKELLAKMFEEGSLDTQQITEQIKQAVRTSEIVEYKGLPAGPGLDSYDNVIVVEGRADVICLLKSGIKNVIANGGTSVPKEIKNLSREKIVTVFLDGDRGGDLILKELTSTSEIDFVARAPNGKEVEDLTKKEIFKALREKVPVDQAKFEYGNGKPSSKPTTIRKETSKSKYVVEPEKRKIFKKHLEELTGTRAAYFLDSKMKLLGKVPVKEMLNMIPESKPAMLIFDGAIDQKLILVCSKSNVQWVVGMSVGGRIRRPEGLHTVILKDLE